MLIFLTCWGQLVTIISIGLTYYCARDPSFRKRDVLKGWHYGFFMTSMLMNVVITVVYFSVIHPVVQEKHKGETATLYWLFIMHLVPLISTTINFLCTDIVFIRR
mmetsp:Transcript_12918/g.9351  ORF Transcript_12918/g.9351 Transcript_12918/m.9351 type:complete len:105 (-) Transcript_12918:257-571(-)